MYRVLRPLSTGHKVGDLICDGELKEKVIEPLKRAGAIADIQPPPLKVLPDWEERANILSKYNITSAEEFLETGENLLRFILREPPEVLKEWKQEIIDFLR